METTTEEEKPSEEKETNMVETIGLCAKYVAKLDILQQFAFTILVRVI